MKKLLSIILSLALMLSCVTVAFAEDPTDPSTDPPAQPDPQVTVGSNIGITVTGPNGDEIYANEEITLGFTLEGDFNGETFSLSITDSNDDPVSSTDLQFDTYSDTDNVTSLSLTLDVYPDAGAYTVTALYNEPDGTEGDIIEHSGTVQFEIKKAASTNA